MLTKYLIGALVAALILTGWTAWTRDRALNSARTTIAGLEADGSKCEATNDALRGKIKEFARNEAKAIVRARAAEVRARDIEKQRTRDRADHRRHSDALAREVRALEATECSQQSVRPGFVHAYQRLLDNSPDHLGD